MTLWYLRMTTRPSAVTKTPNQDTNRITENDTPCLRLEQLGLELDPDANTHGTTRFKLVTECLFMLGAIQHTLRAFHVFIHP